jgi:hypothetical protein
MSNLAAMRQRLAAIERLERRRELVTSESIAREIDARRELVQSRKERLRKEFDRCQIPERHKVWISRGSRIARGVNSIPCNVPGVCERMMLKARKARIPRNSKHINRRPENECGWEFESTIYTERG